jgi:hypothetical protein
MTSRLRNSAQGLRHENEAAVNAEAVCRNCDASLTGHYCSNCGQPADVHVPSTRELIHEALEGLTHSDSRIWSTLKYLLFSPGRLTQEFVAGRRASYLPPFRLYLILSVAFFLVASFSHFKQQPVIIDTGHRTTEADCTAGALNIFNLAKDPDWNRRLQHACVGIVRDNGTSLLHAGVALMSKAMFVLVPLVAFLHMLLYWWPRYRYAVHLLFFLHLQAFFFFDVTVLALLGDAADKWPALATLDSVGSAILFWWMVVYSVVAMRRVFRMSWWLTLAKAVVLFAVYVVTLGLTVGGVFIYAALQL